MSVEPKFNQATVIGVGLIGGSIAGVIRSLGIARAVVGVGRNKENLDTAVRLGLIDRYSQDARKGVSGSDLVILCCPVGSFEQVAREIKPYLEDRAVVTDAGSVKGELVLRLEEIFYLKARYVPAHPIAGSERSGAEAANLKLFHGARCILTPTRNTDIEALEAVSDLWETAGAKVERMDPFDHDKIFGMVSHLPHVAAYAMVGALTQMDGGEDAISYAAGGFKDFTRIAGSHPGMWRDICLFNSGNISDALGVYIKSLERLRSLMESGDGEALLSEFEKARAVRQRIK